MNSEYIKLGIWVVVIGGLFIYLWRKGHLARLTAYIQETREELRKCTWPTWDELKGATVVVMVSTLLVGLYTVVIDIILSRVLLWVTRI